MLQVSKNGEENHFDIKINKFYLTFIPIVIGIIGGIIGVVMWSSSVAADVDHMKENQAENNEIIRSNQAAVNIMGEQIENIEDDVTEIKSDVKMLVQEQIRHSEISAYG